MGNYFEGEIFRVNLHASGTKHEAGGGAKLCICILTATEPTDTKKWTRKPFSPLMLACASPAVLTVAVLLCDRQHHRLRTPTTARDVGALLIVISV
jgi:hypothetical protein